MNKIKRIGIVNSKEHKPDDFIKNLQESVEKLQQEGMDVEIQSTQPFHFTDMDGSDALHREALIIARQGHSLER